jgi:hypothetical protein
MELALFELGVILCEEKHECLRLIGVFKRRTVTIGSISNPISMITLYNFELLCEEQVTFPDFWCFLVLFWCKRHGNNGHNGNNGQDSA